MRFMVYLGLPKTLNFWIRADEANANRILAALVDFGFEDIGLTIDDLTSRHKIIQLGLPPNRIDLITSVDGIEFDSAFTRRIESSYAGIPLLVIHLEDLIANKAASGRDQDLLDLKKLRGT